MCWSLQGLRSDRTSMRHYHARKSGSIASWNGSYDSVVESQGKFAAKCRTSFRLEMHTGRFSCCHQSLQGLLQPRKQCARRETMLSDRRSFPWDNARGTGRPAIGSRQAVSLQTGGERRGSVPPSAPSTRPWYSSSALL